GVLRRPDLEDGSPFASYPVPPVELLAACHHSFPLQRGRVIEISRLASHPLLLLDQGFLVRSTFDDARPLAGLPLKLLLERRPPLELAGACRGGARCCSHPIRRSDASPRAAHRAP